MNRKWMIASDLHGSAHYCKLLLERFREEQAERLVFLGDLLYHGPRNDLPEEYDTKAVAKLLNEVKNSLLCVKGNCDSEVDQMVLHFPMLAEYAAIPVGDRLCYLTHGHKYGPENPPALMEGDLLMCGHTHVPTVQCRDGYIYLNPGSVSLPKENSPHSYVILEDGVFTWKDVCTGEAYHVWNHKEAETWNWKN